MAGNIKMPVKKNIEIKTMKFHVPADVLASIDAKRVAADYTTRTDYMIDSALFGSPVYLEEIAVNMGRLGQICNGVLLLNEEDDRQNCLKAEDVKRALRKVIKTCDAISAALGRL